MINQQQPAEKDREVLGRGWGFPLKMTLQGGLQLSEDVRSLDESIAIILGTRLGERVYRPEFGSRLHELVFAPLNDDTLLLAQVYAREAVQKWEPRVAVEAVTAEIAHNSVSLTITVYYRVRETNHRRSMVYPFYLTPASDV